jgi:hypothetical protein
MTVFVEIGKLFLRKAIQEAINNSIAADNSCTNAILGLVNCARDLNVAEAKRNELMKLQKAIDQFKSDQPDAIALVEFQILLNQYKSKNAELARTHQLNEGATGQALTQALELIQSIFLQLQRIELLDIATDQNPLNIFQYFSAKYFAIKIFNDQRANTIQQATGKLSISIVRERANKRELLIHETLKQSIQHLAMIRKDLPNYSTVVIDRIIENINALLRQDKELCAESPLINIATTLADTIRLSQQDDQLLPDCMLEALTDIKKLKLAKEPISPDGWLVEDEEKQWAEKSKLETEMQLAAARLKIETDETLTRSEKQKNYLSILIETHATFFNHKQPASEAPADEASLTSIECA